MKFTGVRISSDRILEKGHPLTQYIGVHCSVVGSIDATLKFLSWPLCDLIVLYYSNTISCKVLSQVDFLFSILKSLLKSLCRNAQEKATEKEKDEPL